MNTNLRDVLILIAGLSLAGVVVTSALQQEKRRNASVCRVLLDKATTHQDSLLVRSAQVDRDHICQMYLP